MRTALSLLALLAWASLGQAEIIYVDIDATGANDGKSWANAHVDLQDALSRARKNDRVLIAEGEYRPTHTDDQTRSFVLIDGVDMYGGYSGSGTERHPRQYRTILSGDIGLPTASQNDATHDDPDVIDNSLVVVDATRVTRGAVIDGLHIEGCASYLTDPEGIATGLLAGPTTRGLELNEVVVSGTRGHAGIVLDRSEVVVTGSTFTANEGRDAGGAYLAGARARFETTGFYGNNGSFTHGGAIHARDSETEVAECVVYGGHAAISGGAIRVAGGTIDIDRTHITDAGRGGPTLAGGALALSRGAAARVTNSTIDWSVAARGGAVANDGSALDLIHATLVFNYANDSNGAEGPGGTLSNSNGATSTIANSIVLRSFEPGGPVSVVTEPGSETRIRASMVEGSNGSGDLWDTRYGVDEGLNIDARPLFLEARWRDYRLLIGSPGVNAGDPERVPRDRGLDYAGAPRVFGTAPDMGAFELQCPSTDLYFDARVTPRTLNRHRHSGVLRVKVQAREPGWFSRFQATTSFGLAQHGIRPIDVSYTANGALLDFDLDEALPLLPTGEAIPVGVRVSIGELKLYEVVADTIRVIGSEFTPDNSHRFKSLTLDTPYSNASPNPFNPSTTIYFGTPDPGYVELTVYDLAGRRVKTLVAERVTAGDHEVSWDGRDGDGQRVASGVYLYRLKTDDFVDTKRMVLVK